MTEHTTSGLVNLFALFSLYSDNPGISRKKVESFLQFHFGRKSTEEFLALYDELLNYYESAGIEPATWMAFASQVIEKLESKITRNEIILVYLRLLELLSTSQNSHILSLVDKTSELFKIDADLKKELVSFIKEDDWIRTSPAFLLISSENNDYQNFIKRNIKGRLIVYNNAAFGITVVRLIGDDELFVESGTMQPYSFQALEEGDTVRGNSIAPVHYAEIRRKLSNILISNPIVFESDTITYKFPNGAYGLHPFSFREQSGSFIAIMGASGAGKTTLLNILNGSLSPTTGNLYINGYNIHSETRQTEGLIGYVPQEDMLFEDLTVFQNLYYSAKLSLKGLSEKEITERVNQALYNLDLQAVKDLKVGSYLNKSISGGQRKRLNIAMELIRKPAILLVDEPTSGLSSADAVKVIQFLREQSNIGNLILINIHQPSSEIFRMFDSLWILDQGGYLIYKGAPIDAISYFKTQAYHNYPDERECSECGALNPEMIFRIIEDKIIDGAGQYSSLRKNTPEEWFNIFNEKNRQQIGSLSDKTGNAVSASTKPSKLKQFLIFFRRNLRVKISNKPYILITLLQTPLLAMICAYFTYYSTADGYTLIQNKYLPIYLFMSVIVSLFSGMMASAEEIIRERAVLKRERFLNLSWGSYLNSKIIFLFLISAFQSFVFVLTGNSILHIENQFFLYWITLFSTSCVANLIGLNLSNVLNSPAAIYISIPIILIPQMLLGGLIVEFDDLARNNKTNNNVSIIGDISTSRWAYEALATGQFRYNDYQIKFFDSEKDQSNCSYYSNILLYELERRANQSMTEVPVIPVQDKTIIINELNEIYEKYPVLKRKVITGDNAEILKEIAFLRSQFKSWKNDAEDKLDAEILSAENQLGKAKFEALRQKSSNNALADMVRKSNSTEFYRETGSRLVRLYNPVYKEPESNFGAAHFYASDKLLFGYMIETPVFNIFIIWLQGIILYLLLYFNLFRPRNKN